MEIKNHKNQLRGFDAEILTMGQQISSSSKSYTGKYIQAQGFDCLQITLPYEVARDRYFVKYPSGSVMGVRGL